MKLLSCAAQFRRIYLKIKHELITEQLWSIFMLQHSPALPIHTYTLIDIHVSVCLNRSISNQVSAINCLKETGIFTRIHEIVQKLLEEQ